MDPQLVDMSLFSSLLIGKADSQTRRDKWKKNPTAPGLSLTEKKTHLILGDCLCLQMEGTEGYSAYYEVKEITEDEFASF